MVMLLPVFVFVVGVLVYALASNTKVAEIGRAAVWCGILVTLLEFAGRTTRILG